MRAGIDTSAFLRLFIPDGEIPSGLEEYMRAVERGENLAMAHNLTVYDALFVALARQKRARLFTADAKVARVARDLGLA
jgi:predicted nucleic acid-binding protein